MSNNHANDCGKLRIGVLSEFKVSQSLFEEVWTATYFNLKNRQIERMLGNILFILNLFILISLNSELKNVF